jgi:serine/threonine-protein kinase
VSGDVAPSIEDPFVGRVIEGRFEVKRRLAAGGMGVVYEAIQQPLGRVVAFKILENKGSAQDENFSKRFFLEASAAARLAHPNTIVVHDYGKSGDGLFFIAMEYLDGGTLGDRLRKQGPLTPSEAIHVGLQIVSSLRDAHAQGLVHRDLKPGNVMFAPRGGDPSFVKVLDFGLVKMVNEGQDLALTQSGVMMGSPRYMAPEQVKAQQIDARTDIYSFGAVLYHMLTGAPPFHAGSAFEAMNHHVYTPPPPLRATWPGCTAGAHLEAVVMRCLEKEPASRFQGMDEIIVALKGCEAEAGSVESGAGSYISASYSALQARPPITAPGATGSAPSLPGSPFAAPPAAPASGSQPSISESGMRASSPYADQPAANRAKTMRFDAPPSLAPPPVEAPPASGGALKIVVAGLVLVVAAVAAASAALLIPMGDETEHPVDTPAPVAETPVDPVEPPVVAPPVAPPVVQPPVAQPPVIVTQQLMLRTDPPSARVRRDGFDLGDTPLPLMIPAGERWTLEISLQGYETRTVTVLGGQPELLLHLTPVAPERPIARPRNPIPVPQPEVRPLGPAPTPRPRNPAVYAPDLDDPWAH